MLKQTELSTFNTLRKHKGDIYHDHFHSSTAIKAFSVWQPSAFLITHGLKQWETRSWSTRYRGKIVVCSTIKVTPFHSELYLNLVSKYHLKLDPFLSLPRGFALAIATLSDCQKITPELISQLSPLEFACGHWQHGYYAWKLEGIQPINPIAVKGKQGLWNFPSPELITNKHPLAYHPPKKHGERGHQKHPPSGHLAPTIQTKRGIFYPRIDGLDEQERRARLHDHPEDVPEWFVWLYQWGEKDPDTGLWRTRSKRVPTYQIFSIKNAIASDMPIAEILKLIDC